MSVIGYSIFSSNESTPTGKEAKRYLFVYLQLLHYHLTMNPASEWFYGTIQQKFGLAGASLASSSEMNQCIEDLGLGSMESIEQGMLLRKK